ncbi:hypothetical protein K438DRAFT_1847891 [Mycena galopus ATCC 62051]|nr:hypothetical protein K438DRAFT_1847891 [Mycena galopus ATCC 62051]
MDQGASTPQTPEKVHDLWFTTDTIIIRAENKMFRVPGGILAARSSVFRDMFAFPQPQSGEDQMDGCPVLRLGDSAADVEVFLRAILDSNYFMPAPAPNNFLVVLGILRLSHKYDVQYLYRRALEHLAADGWYNMTYDGDSEDHLELDDDPPVISPLHALGVICAATEVGALWLLPAAYYHLSTHSSGALLPLLDGSLGTHVGKALAAHTHLVCAEVSIHSFLTKFDSCATGDTCDKARNSALPDLLAHVCDRYLHPVPSNLMQDTMDNMESLGLCNECRESAKTRLHEAASAFWDSLPDIFGLPPWNELHAMKRVAMGESDDAD